MLRSRQPAGGPRFRIGDRVVFRSDMVPNQEIIYSDAEEKSYIFYEERKHRILQRCGFIATIADIDFCGFYQIEEDAAKRWFFADSWIVGLADELECSVPVSERYLLSLIEG